MGIQLASNLLELYNAPDVEIHHIAEKPIGGDLTVKVVDILERNAKERVVGTRFILGTASDGSLSVLDKHPIEIYAEQTVDS